MSLMCKMKQLFEVTTMNSKRALLSAGLLTLTLGTGAAP